MPLFLELTTLLLEVAPSSASALPQSMYLYLSAPPGITLMPNPLANEVKHIKELLQIVSNELININCQQTMPSKPCYQSYQGGRPSCQQNQFQGVGACTNSQSHLNHQIVLVPIPLQYVLTSSSKELIARQQSH